MAKRKITGRKRSTSTTSLLAGSSTSATSGKSARLSASNELNRLSLQSVAEQKGIQFGSAPGFRQASAGNSSSGLITDLLKTGASGGIKSLFSGGLPGLFGGSLFSGIAGLFGGGEEPPAPLVAFSLPDTQSRTLDVGDPAGFPGARTTLSKPPSATIYSDRNGEIVRAVKQALLTSNQLSDIISEL